MVFRNVIPDIAVLGRSFVFSQSCVQVAASLPNISSLAVSTLDSVHITLESWYTNSEQEPLNQCQQLPAPYKRLTHDLKRNQQTIY